MPHGTTKSGTAVQSQNGPCDSSESDCGSFLGRQDEAGSAEQKLVPPPELCAGNQSYDWFMGCIYEGVVYLRGTTIHK
jgi:hypothetical protein